jgi:quercetin dioxygenase-like cupin family protein
MQQQTLADPYVERSRYYTLDQGFNVGRPPVPPRIFTAERDEALASTGTASGAGGSRSIPCDLSAAMGGGSIATAPLLLASYLRVVPGVPLQLRSGGTAEIFYAIRGGGTLAWGGGEMRFEQGDVMLLPGGGQEKICAGRRDGAEEGEATEATVLWRCTNEPQLAYDGAVPPPLGQARIRPTHFRRGDMLQALADAKKLTMRNGMKSMAIMLGSADSAQATIAPSLTLALNSIPPNDHQVPHKHNSVAISLVLAGKDCHSTVDDVTVPWSRYATFVTPAGAVHAHHNGSAEDAMLLIVQDGGLYAHCRTMGFAVAEE